MFNSVRSCEFALASSCFFISLNSLSVRVLYIVSMVSEWIPGTQIGYPNRCPPCAFVYKTNGISMISNFSYSTAPLKITLLCQECKLYNRTNGFSMFLAWSPVVFRWNTMVSLYGVSQTQLSPCMALFEMFRGASRSEVVIFLDHGVQNSPIKIWKKKLRLTMFLICFPNGF